MKPERLSPVVTALLLCGVSVCIIAVSVVSGPRFLNPFAMDMETCRTLLAIRMPRTVVALLMGGALGASGAILQGIFRNPLADPYVLGISSGASLVASLGLMFGLSLFPLNIPTLAFGGAIATGCAVMVVGRGWRGLQPERLLLAGVGVGFFLSAVLMLVMSVAVDDGLKRAILWMSGDLSMVEWELLPPGLLFTSTGLALALSRRKGLNALTLGDDIAHSLGFNPVRERFLLFVAASLMTAASVSMGGSVGFVGLVVPQIVRRHIGSDALVTLPLSVVAGGTLLCLADAVGRTVAAPMELPAGIISAIIGSPYFIFLLSRDKHR